MTGAFYAKAMRPAGVLNIARRHVALLVRTQIVYRMNLWRNCIAVADDNADGDIR